MSAVAENEEVVGVKRRRLSTPAENEAEIVGNEIENAENQAENERTFVHFTSLPAELRAMMIERMHPDDRCRFERCSKLCQSEAKASKNYIHELGFRICSKFNMLIYVVHGNDKLYPNTGFVLEFKQQLGKNYMIYQKRDETELWRVEFDHSSVAENAFQYFTKFLELHQRVIRVLFVQLRSNDFELNHDFGITKTNQLEELWIEGKFDYLQFISKLRDPLKQLVVIKNNLYQYPLEQVFRVQNHMCYHDLKLNHQQYLRFTASSLHTHIGELTVQNVVSYLRSWKNGTIGRKMKEIYWDLQGSDFNVEKLFLLFGKDISNRESDAEVALEIKHDKDDGKLFVMKTDFIAIRVFFHGDC